jgi:hypothetical protein
MFYSNNRNLYNTNGLYNILNLMKLGGSLGNDPQKLKQKIIIKTGYIEDC